MPDWQPSTRNDVPDLIVDGSPKLQPILGFGACLTDSSCYLLSRMPAAKREALLHEIYSPAEANFSVERGCIGSSDWALSLYNFDDVPGAVEMKHFSIAHDEAYILPTFRQILRIRPDFFLHAAPWSPPGWMKVYGSMKGGWMLRENLAPYSDYLLRFLAAYREAKRMDLLSHFATTQTEGLAKFALTGRGGLRRAKALSPAAHLFGVRAADGITLTCQHGELNGEVADRRALRRAADQLKSCRFCREAI